MPKAYGEFLKSVPVMSSAYRATNYTVNNVSRSQVIISCMTPQWCMTSEELLNEVFVISRITLTKTLITLDITKTES